MKPDQINWLGRKHIVGKRDSYNAKMFIDDVASRMCHRVQLSSDSLHAYDDAVERAFGADVDYGQTSKTYSITNLNKDAASRYSPAEVVKVEKTVVNGAPDVRRITTSHIEKQNHTLRMHCRRLTRLTNASSKKLENFEAVVALNFAYYNFSKTHDASAGRRHRSERVDRCGFGCPLWRIRKNTLNACKWS